MKYKVLYIILLLSPYQLMAKSDGNAVSVTMVKINQQVDAVKKRAKKGDLIAINPVGVSSVCDFTKTIFVNNYVSGVPVTAYCSYIGYVRKFSYK